VKDFLAQYMPPDYSLHGPRLDELNAYVHWLMLILFVIWGALFAYMLIRFRASNHPKADYHGTKSHVSTWGEIAVAVVELVLLFGISIPAWSNWTTPPGPETNPLEIRVIAQQFNWNIHYPGPDHVFGKADPKFITDTNQIGLDPNDPNGKDDVMTVNQLHIELNRAVIVRLSSKDVIHSFGLPVMRVKQDAIPGMEVPIHFTPVHATPKGEEWNIACAQLCGIGHANMKGYLVVQTKQDFEAWLKENAPVTAAPATPAPAAAPQAAPAEPAAPAPAAEAPAHT